VNFVGRSLPVAYPGYTPGIPHCTVTVIRAQDVSRTPKGVCEFVLTVKNFCSSGEGERVDWAFRVKDSPDNRWSSSSVTPLEFPRVQLWLCGVSQATTPGSLRVLATQGLVALVPSKPVSTAGFVTGWLHKYQLLNVDVKGERILATHGNRNKVEIRLDDGAVVLPVCVANGTMRLHITRVFFVVEGRCKPRCGSGAVTLQVTLIDGRCCSNPFPGTG
jgi:hypothetical protein